MYEWNAVSVCSYGWRDRRGVFCRLVFGLGSVQEFFDFLIVEVLFYVCLVENWRLSLRIRLWRVVLRA